MFSSTGNMRSSVMAPNAQCEIASSSLYIFFQFRECREKKNEEDKKNSEREKEMTANIQAKKKK